MFLNVTLFCPWVIVLQPFPDSLKRNKSDKAAFLEESYGCKRMQHRVPEYSEHPSKSDCGIVCVANIQCKCKCLHVYAAVAPCVQCLDDRSRAINMRRRWSVRDWPQIGTQFCPLYANKHADYFHLHRPNALFSNTCKQQYTSPLAEIKRRKNPRLNQYYSLVRSRPVSSLCVK